MFKCFLGIVVGIALLICAALAATDTNEFLKSSVVVSGRVVEFEHGSNHRIIAFITHKGEHISFPDGGFFPPLNMDDHVPVRYIPDAPLQTARLDFFGPIWDGASVLLGFGLVCLLGSLLILYLRRRSDNNSASRSEYKNV